MASIIIISTSIRMTSFINGLLILGYSVTVFQVSTSARLRQFGYRWQLLPPSLYAHCASGIDL